MRTRRITWSAVALAMAATVIPFPRAARALTAPEVRRQLEDVKAQLSSIGDRLEEAGHRLEASLEAVALHRKSLAEAQHRKGLLQDTVSARAAQLYMLGTEAEYAFGTELTEIADRITYLDEMDRGSRALLEEIVTLQQRADVETAGLNAALSKADTARAELDAHRAEVASRLADLSRLYTFLKSIDPRFAERASRGGVRGFMCPVVGPTAVRNDYGAPRRGGPHTGVDLDGTSGQPLRAVLPAHVVDTPTGGWMGLGVIIRDPAGNEWWYAHLSSRSVRVGERLSAGEFIGRIGCTGHCFGSHLHFEYHPGGGDPTDPYPIVSRAC